MADEREDETTTGQPAQEAEESTRPGFTQGDTPSEEELSDPDVGGTAGGGPAGA